MEFYETECVTCHTTSPRLPSLEHSEGWMVGHTATLHPDEMKSLREALALGPLGEMWWELLGTYHDGGEVSEPCTYIKPEDYNRETESDVEQ